MTEKDWSDSDEERSDNQKIEGTEMHLKGCSRQDQSVSRRVVLTEGDRELALGVLHSMTLVDDHVHPLDLAEERLLPNDVLECRDKDLEVAALDLCSRDSTSFDRSLEDDSRDRRRPLLELERPVGDRRERDDDEVGALLLLGFDEEGDERERLDRLSETL